MQINKLQTFLSSKYKNSNDFKIIGSNIFSKTSISYQTLQGINNIEAIKAVYYLSNNSKPYKMGYKIGICLMSS